MAGNGVAPKSQDIEDEQALGGLRRPMKAALKNRSCLEVGWRIREAIFSLFDVSPQLVQEKVEGGGSKTPDRARGR